MQLGESMWDSYQYQFCPIDNKKKHLVSLQNAPGRRDSLVDCSVVVGSSTLAGATLSTRWDPIWRLRYPMLPIHR